MLTLVNVVQIRNVQLINFANPSHILFSKGGYLKSSIMIVVCWGPFEFYLLCIINCMWLLSHRLNFEGRIVIFVARVSMKLCSTLVFWWLVAFLLRNWDVMELWFVRRLALKLYLLSVSGVSHFKSTLMLFLSIFHLKRLEFSLIGGIWYKWLGFQDLSLNN